MYLQDNRKKLTSFTIFPDVSPSSDVAVHASWEQHTRCRQTHRVDIVAPVCWGGQLHQSYIFALIGVLVVRRNHDALHKVGRLLRVEPIQLVPSNVESVRGHIGWTEKKQIYPIKKKKSRLIFSNQNRHHGS